MQVCAVPTPQATHMIPVRRTLSPDRLVDFAEFKDESCNACKLQLMAAASVEAECNWQHQKLSEVQELLRVGLRVLTTRRVCLPLVLVVVRKSRARQGCEFREYIPGILARILGTTTMSPTKLGSLSAILGRQLASVAVEDPQK